MQESHQNRNCIQVKKKSHDKSESCLNNMLPTQALNTVCKAMVRAFNEIKGSRPTGKKTHQIH